MSPLPILDDHIHLQPKGENVKAVMEFQKAGGTHLIVTHLPHKGVRITKPEDFKRQFNITLNLAEKGREKSNVKIFVALGPYPVELLRLADETTLDHSVEIMKAGMDIAGDLVKDGKAMALGEIGRPHFPVSEEIIMASNEIMKYGMKLAKEIGCAVVLHTESGTSKVCEELAKMGKDVGLPAHKIIKHYSPAIIQKKDNHGLFPSVLATKSNIKEAISQGNRFMMETDYLDDPRRPGAVLGIKTVPKRTKTFLEEGVFTEEDVWAIHKENPEKVYGIEIR